MRSALLAATLSLVAWVPRQGEATSHAEALRARAFEAAYNLDHDQAVALFTQALAEAPDDIAAHRGVATVQWLEITFARGTISGSSCSEARSSACSAAATTWRR